MRVDGPVRLRRMPAGEQRFQLLAHRNRIDILVEFLKRAADRPVGWVDSAVMLNARLKPGVNLMHVMAMTQSLGERLSAADVQPEVYRWTDGTQSHVTCEFVNGRLQKWTLQRPQAQEPTAAE